jgi:hypothetical protein
MDGLGSLLDDEVSAFVFDVALMEGLLRRLWKCWIIDGDLLPQAERCPT